MKNISILLLGLALAFTQSLHAQGNLGKANARKSYNTLFDNSINQERNATGGYYQNQNQTAQSMPAYAYLRNDSVMEIGSRVLMNVPADGYIVIFSLTQVGEDLETCNSLMNERIDGFRKSLERVGIEESNTKVDIISQVPTFEFEVEKKLFSKYAVEVPSGFELKKNVHVYYSQPSLINKILEQAATHEIYDITKVEFVINDVGSVYDSLRKAAAKDILSKKKVYEMLGIKFDPLFHVVGENISSVSPDERYQTAEAYSAQAVPSKTRGVTRTKKDISYFYDRVGYVDFDQYLNANEIAPSMQFVCHLKVRYSLKRQ